MQYVPIFLKIESKFPLWLQWALDHTWVCGTHYSLEYAYNRFTQREESRIKNFKN